MEAAGTSRHPDFPGNSVSIDNNLAAIAKLDFQDASGSQLKIDIRRAGFECGIDPGQGRVGQQVEFFVFHRMLPSRSLLTGSSPMPKVFAILLTCCLAACGTKMPLQMPEGPVPEPLLGNPKPTPAKSTTVPDVSTATKTNPQ
jgi:hypothetical protein